jgi:tetratricopeptide (TPR) repeat protein
VLGGWLGLTQAQISRIENGPPVRHLDSLTHWARTLRIPEHLLWFKLPERQPDGQPNEPARPARERVADRAHVCIDRQGRPDEDDMNRREFLRLLSMASTLVATRPLVRQDDLLDRERLDHPAGRARLDPATVAEYEALNSRLWAVFASSKPKSAAFPLVRSQLDALTGSLRQSHDEATHRRLCGLTADVFQLAGELYFDENRYTDAAHCYTLAASAGREAGAFDLWACAMTRHAFIAVYERQFDKAAPLLEVAARLARRGDGTLSTRHWVDVVRAQTFAGLGEVAPCQRALDAAEQVDQLDGPVHNGGWLRFDGSRLAEERGTCYVELRRSDLAEAALTDALGQDLSLRRRGSVLTDLAMVGAQRGDPEQLVMYADAALDVARQTGSGVVGRKLQRLRAHLGPFAGDRHVRHLDEQITALAGTST